MDRFFCNLTVEPLTNGTALLRLALTVVMGSILGLERTRKLRPAGLRTYTLVCTGACIVMLVGIYIYQGYGPGFDPARMAAQVISGIGFIGAGTIIVTSKRKVKGLTTAAGLWAAACLGLVVGAGFYSLAIGAFLTLLLTMTYADKLERFYFKRLRRMSLSIIVTSLNVLSTISTDLKAHDATICDIEISDAIDCGGVTISGILRMDKHMDHDKLLEHIMTLDGVIFAEILDL